MDTEYKFDFEAVLDRVKQAMQFDTDAQVAEFIGMSPSGLGNRKRSGSIPFENICKACASRCVNLEWVLTGSGPQDRVMAVYSRLDPYELDLMSEITRAVWIALEDEGFAENDASLLDKAGIRGSLSALIYNRVAFIKSPEERTAAIFKDAEAFAYAAMLSARADEADDARGPDGSA
jgi:hypothetical protein